MEKWQNRDQELYKWLEMYDYLGNGPYGRFRKIKPGLNWKDYLSPEEEEKFNSLLDGYKMAVCMSCDPIEALKNY